MVATSDVVGLAGGDNFTMVLRADGTVATCGANQDGQLGNGAIGGPGLTPTTIAGLIGTTRIGAGLCQAFAATADGTVYGWDGRGLGNGAGTGQSAPVRLAEAGSTWLAGRPTFTPSGGTYTAVQTIQTATYLGDRVGRMGVIVTRQPPTEAMQRKVLSLWNDSSPRKTILTPADADLRQLLELRCRNASQTAWMQEHYRAFRTAVQ